MQSYYKEKSFVRIWPGSITVISFQNLKNYSGELGKGLHNFTINGTDLAPSVYTYRILGANFSEAAKAVLIK